MSLLRGFIVSPTLGKLLQAAGLVGEVLPLVARRLAGSQPAYSPAAAQLFLEQLAVADLLQTWG